MRLSTRYLRWLLLVLLILATAAPMTAQDAATSELIKQAESGDASSQYNLGVAYENGEDVSADFAEAARWYRKAAEQGNAEAQANLGGMYAKGKGVAKDEEEAVRWYRKAAEQGNAEAQHALVVMNVDQGIAKDEAARHTSQPAADGIAELIKKAESGDAKAQYQLGVMYDNGLGVPKDAAEAIRWWRKAAAQGNKDAQAHIVVEKAEPEQARQRFDPDLIMRSYDETQRQAEQARKSAELQAREQLNTEHKLAQEAVQWDMAEQRAIAKMPSRWPKSQCIRAVNNFLKLNYPPSFFVDWDALHATTLALVSERLTACESYPWTYEERNQLAEPLPFKQVVDAEQKWLNQNLNLRIAEFIKQRGLMEKFAWEGGGRNNTVLLSDTFGFIKRHSLMADFTRYDDLQVDKHRRNVDKHGIGLLFGVAENDVP